MVRFMWGSTENRNGRDLSVQELQSPEQNALGGLKAKAGESD
jgi:hypothetical protein